MVLNDPAEMGFTEQLDTGREEQAATAAAFLEAQGSSRQAADGPAVVSHRPFLLSVSMFQCHRPFGAQYDPEVVDRVEVPPYLPDTSATRRDLATLAWQIHDLDRRVGLILAAIDRAGLAGDTLVVFTTEHGPAIARAKHTTYDSGLRTALLLRLPGVIPGRHDRGHDDQQCRPVAHPQRPVRAARPRCRARHELGGAPRRRRHAGGAPLCIQRIQLGAAQRGTGTTPPSRTIRGTRYKLMRGYRRIPIYVDSGWLARYAGDHDTVERWYDQPLPDTQLFDLQEDPFELRNLAGDPALAPVEADLKQRLDRHLRATDDPILHGSVPNRAGEPRRAAVAAAAGRQLSPGHRRPGRSGRGLLHLTPAPCHRPCRKPALHETRRPLMIGVNMGAP